MMQMLETWWPLFVIALLIGIAVAWYVLVASRKTRVSDRGNADVLAEGAAPAGRNQALINAAPAATPQPPVTPTGVAGAGTAVAAAVEEQQVRAAEDAAAGTPAPAAAKHGTETGERDDLTRIKGVGPKLCDILVSLGVARFAQIAAWSDADIERIDSHLGRFQGRIRRDDWVRQARFLAEGDTAGYEASFGKL